MDPLAPLIASLRAEGRLRVWSLVITAFGDLVQHRGGTITTTRLGAVLGRIGVEPGALRTALSRLASDGWVERERQGRTSLCRLSDAGLAQFGPATSRIYAPPSMAPITQWSLSATVADGTPHLRLEPAGGATGDVVVTGTLDQITPAFREASLDPACRVALTYLAADLAALADVKVPLDAAAARLLLIHRWRRIVLRFPELLPDVMPETAPLSDPRRAVAQAYAGLSGAAEEWLSTPLPGDHGMPPADAGFADRFSKA